MTLFIVSSLDHASGRREAVPESREAGAPPFGSRHYRTQPPKK